MLFIYSIAYILVKVYLKLEPATVAEMGFEQLFADEIELRFGSDIVCSLAVSHPAQLPPDRALTPGPVL